MTVSKGQPAKPGRRRTDRSEDPAHNATPGHQHHLVIPNADAKTVIVNALAYYLKRDDLSTHEHDSGLAVMLQLVRELRNG